MAPDKASSLDCNDCHLGKTKRRLRIHDRKRITSRPFQNMITLLLYLITLKQVVTTSKWDHFDILASDKTDYHCKV